MFVLIGKAEGEHPLIFDSKLNLNWKLYNFSGSDVLNEVNNQKKKKCNIVFVYIFSKSF